MEIYLVIIVFVLVILLGVAIYAVALALRTLLGGFHIETPQKRAGRLGELFATRIISEIQYDDDVLLTNVRIYADGKQTELDNVIINQNGIFIIEVKNLSGQLVGDEDTHDWIQIKTSYAGNVYQKSVKNPIKQVKRQIYILSRYLKDNGIHAWIEGYVFFVERNSPINSKFVLKSRKDIDNAIHRDNYNRLSYDDIDGVLDVLK